MNDNLLEKTFAQYLESRHDFHAGKEFCQVLQKVGLIDEGRALLLYLQQGSGLSCSFQRPPWAHRRCFVSTTPPVEAQFGDLWLDTVEMNVAVLVPNRPGTSPRGIGWISIHPVWVWQFRTFLQFVQIGRERTELPFPEDFLKPTRFFQMSSMEYVTNLYHDEAYAYARWFGKVLISQLDLANAQSYLQPELFQSVLPINLSIWDSSEDVEELRLAIGHHSIERTPSEEVKLWMRRQQPSGSDRMVYGEWERNPKIGCSTVTMQALEIDRTKTSHTVYFDLNNAALNISGATTK